jgi:hypothetical protein
MCFGQDIAPANQIELLDIAKLVNSLFSNLFIQNTPYSLFAIPYSLFPIPYPLPSKLCPIDLLV